jgi:hypothetical protein
MEPGEEKKHPLQAWDEAATFGASVRAFLPLCGQILFRPVDFFKQFSSAGHADIKRRLIRAVAFALILGYIKLFLDVTSLYWFKYFSKSIFSVSGSLQISALSGTILTSPFFLLRPLLVFAVSVVLVATGIKLILGMDRALIGAFFVICFRSAADLFYCIPLVGGVFALVWSVAIIIIGLRESYKTGFLRSIAAGIVMPVTLLVFILVGMGPALNRTIISFYPEMKMQMASINDVTAYATMSSIVAAAGDYKRDLGFYPAHPGVLRKYASDSIIDDAVSPRHPGGYIYQYSRSDDQHYRLEARPKEPDVTGRFIFYADESGQVRFNGPDGPAIKDIREVEERITGK